MTERTLKQDEIDALFEAARAAAPEPARPEACARVVPYDFTSAGQISTEQLRAISTLNDQFARNLTRNLAAWLRTRFQVNLVSAEQIQFHEFLLRIPEISYVASVRLQPLGALSVLQLDLGLAPPIIDLLLGDAADVKAGGVFSADRIGGLMKKFAADGKVLRHLPLQQPAEEPIILVVGAAAVIDPITAAAIGQPIAEALLHPNGKKSAHMAGAKALGLVSGRQFEKRKHADHRRRAVFVFLDESILEAQLGIAIAELGRAAGRTVERHRRDDVKLPVGNDAVVVFECRPDARCVAGHRGAHRERVELVVLVIDRLGSSVRNGGPAWATHLGNIANPIAAVTMQNATQTHKHTLALHLTSRFARPLTAAMESLPWSLAGKAIAGCAASFPPAIRPSAQLGWNNAAIAVFTAESQRTSRGCWRHRAFAALSAKQ